MHQYGLTNIWNEKLVVKLNDESYLYYYNELNTEDNFFFRSCIRFLISLFCLDYFILFSS